MRKKTELDKDDEKLIADYERGAFRPVKNQVMTRREAVETVRRSMRKDARINTNYRPPTLKCSSNARPRKACLIKV